MIFIVSVLGMVLGYCYCACLKMHIKEKCMVGHFRKEHWDILCYNFLTQDSFFNLQFSVC